MWDMVQAVAEATGSDAELIPPATWSTPARGRHDPEQGQRGAGGGRRKSNDQGPHRSNMLQPRGRTSRTHAPSEAVRPDCKPQTCSISPTRAQSAKRKDEEIALFARKPACPYLGLWRLGQQPQRNQTALFPELGWCDPHGLRVEAHGGEPTNRMVYGASHSSRGAGSDRRRPSGLGRWRELIYRRPAERQLHLHG